MITFTSQARRSPIQIALQDHLSCYLINVASGVSCLLACVTQSSLGRDGRQALVPGHNRARQNSAQLFYKLKNFRCGCSKLAIHPTGNTGYDMIDFFLADDFRNARGCMFICWNGFQGMRQ
jgi:hypothetical protein